MPLIIAKSDHFTSSPRPKVSDRLAWERHRTLRLRLANAVNAEIRNLYPLTQYKLEVVNTVLELHNDANREWSFHLSAAFKQLFPGLSCESDGRRPAVAS